MTAELDFRYLKAFIVVGRTLSFSKAAQQLGISQSAVSRQIKLLEESLKEQLLVRSSQKALLTAKGQLFLETLKDFENKSLDIFTQNPAVTIRVGILHGLLENWFIPRLKEFSKSSHHLIDVEPDTPENLKLQLERAYYDVIFTTENIQSDLSSSLKLFSEELVLIISEDLHVTGKVIKASEWGKYPWIAYSELDNLFSLPTARPAKIHIVKSMTSIVKMVQSGVGLAIVPLHVIESFDGLHVQKVKEIESPSIYMSTLNYKNIPTALNEFIEVVKAKV